MRFSFFVPTVLFCGCSIGFFLFHGFVILVFFPVQLNLFRAELSVEPGRGSAFVFEGVGHAELKEGATFAFGLAHGGWGDAGVDHFVESLGGRSCSGAEVFVEGHFMAAASFTVVERTIGDGELEHFLETECLGAELHAVAVVFFWFAAFVFDGQHGAVAVELDDVCFSAQAEPMRYDVESACDADAVAGLVGAVVGFFVELVALGGEMVFRPDLLEMDECALPLAEQEVLQCGEGEQVCGRSGYWLLFF